MYVNKKICSKCKGECCRISGCMFSTRDVRGAIKEWLEKLIDEKIVTIYSIPYNFFIMFCFGPQISQLNFSEAMINLLDKINQIKQYDVVYILKVRSENRDTFIRIQSFDDISTFTEAGKCIMKNDNGCYFNDNERPYGGLMLKPDERGINYCKCDFSVLDAAFEWLQYHVLIDEIFNKKEKN